MPWARHNTSLHFRTRFKWLALPSRVLKMSFSGDWVVDDLLVAKPSETQVHLKTLLLFRPCSNYRFCPN